MTAKDELLAELGEINTKVDWCVSALKYLLTQQAGGVVELSDDDWLEDEPAAPSFDAYVGTLDELRAAAQADEDRLHPRPPPPPANTCPHNAQGILDGKLVCLRCNTPLAASGVIQDRLSLDGTRIIADPNPPMHRAGAFTREASAQNGRG